MHETDHSPSSSDEVKNVWSYTTTPPIFFHGIHISNFTCFVSFTGGILSATNPTWTDLGLNFASVVTDHLKYGMAF